ncbi:hypothetical protein [Mameliella alba]|uniref:hypothetical protein n=1 Tax=Mameliella alba TaxID=561184 RepID=UPI000B530ABD|nr:hypothetical protein [Mameliella alba]OWV39415.1 hypothetical protein CDZ95_26170 [Mameliella alba]
MMARDTFDRCEEIATAMHDQDGLATALIRYIAGLDLPSDQEHVIYALIHAQGFCRNRVTYETRHIVQETKLSA